MNQLFSASIEVGNVSVLLTDADVARFWSKVTREGTNCWLWKDSADKNGYGKMWLRSGRSGVTVRAHRIAMVLSGRIPGEVVLHTCDTPACCNPAHLIAGTQADNRADCRDKGRTARGLRQHRGTISDDQVREIRRRYRAGERTVDLANEFGVWRMTIYNIGSGKWRPYVTDVTP